MKFLHHPRSVLLPRRSVISLLWLALIVPTVLVGSPAAAAAPDPVAHITPDPVATATPSPAVTATPDPVASADVESADECGGTLALGQVVGCQISGEDVHTYSVTTAADSDRLLARLRYGPGDSLIGRILAPGGEPACYLGGAYLTTCQLGPAGVYTVEVNLYHLHGANDYTLAVESMLTPSSCTRLPNSFFSFASPGHSATLPTGAAAQCYHFDQPTGSVLYLTDPGGLDVRGQILNAQYQPVCTVSYPIECTLATPGPYRLFMQEHNGYETSYTLKLPRLSKSAGCPVLRLADFGDPGENSDTATIPPEGITCHKVRTTAAGIVTVRINPDQDLRWTLYDAEGRRVCAKSTSSRTCLLPTSGGYTLLVENQDIFDRELTYQVAVPALFRLAGCAPNTGTSWDLPALLVHQTSAVQTNCQRFRGNAGDRIVTYAAPTAYNSLTWWLVDSTGAAICTEPSEQDGCVLPATGVYRVISYLRTWDEGSTDLTYEMQIRRLSGPVGCPTVTPGAYGEPAGEPGGIRCRIVDVPAAGTYVLKAVNAENRIHYGEFYDPTGLRASGGCGTAMCTFPAAGRYTMVLNGSDPTSVIDNDVIYSVVFLHGAPSGCSKVSDTGYAQAPHRGEFRGPGQHDCLELPTPAGAELIELLPTDGTVGFDTTIVDATGDYVCGSLWALRQYSCALTGTAPFYAVLSAYEGRPTGAYLVAYARMDGPPDCPVLPEDEAGATVATGADRFAVCFSIPADQRVGRETIAHRRLSGDGLARLSVFAASGIRYCGPTNPSADRTLTCSLPDGPVTVILQAASVDASYQITRHGLTSG